MARRRPPARIVPQRSRNNAKRRLSVLLPTDLERDTLTACVSYGCYSKHKYNPAAYNLAPYAGQDEERTYCDEHAGFRKTDVSRAPALLRRGIQLGLCSDRKSDDVPVMLWTIDDNGWIYELRVTNVGLFQYHGYPVLTNDAFAKQVLARARHVAFEVGGLRMQNDPNVGAAIVAAEAFYR